MVWFVVVEHEDFRLVVYLLLCVVSIGLVQTSRSVNVLMTNPIWVIVTRMQTHRKLAKGLATASETPSSDAEALVAVEPRPYGTFNTTREIYEEAGVTGFWKGVIPTLIMVSNPSMQFMLYETMLTKLKKKRALKGTNIITALETFLLGAVAKLGATVTTYPLLVVKSRLQAKQVMLSFSCRQPSAINFSQPESVYQRRI